MDGRVEEGLRRKVQKDLSKVKVQLSAHRQERLDSQRASEKALARAAPP